VRIRRIVLDLAADQWVASHMYVRVLCCSLYQGAPALFLQEDQSLPQEEMRVRMVQQSIGPVDAPEFGETPNEYSGFRYVGTAFAAAYAYHVFVYDAATGRP
jgi:hypothetical protein